MTTKRRDDDRTTIAAASEVDPNVDLERARAVLLPASSPQRLSSSSRSNATNTDDGNASSSSSVVSLKFLCYALIVAASFIFYEDLLVARVAVRKHFFGLESGVGAATLLGEEEPESDLIDTRTGKLDLNLRHISKRKHEHVETIEEHNEKALIDRVGLEKAEEIAEEEEEEEKEGAEMALQIEREAQEKKEKEEEALKAAREKEEEERRIQIEEEEKERIKREEEEKEVREREE